MNHRHLRQTLHLHIVSDCDISTQMKHFNLITTDLDGLINWIMKEAAQNSRNQSVLVQTDASFAQSCITMVK